MVKKGRPRMADKDRSGRLIALRLTSDEHKCLEKAAAKAKLSVSEYVRTKLGLRGGK
jgi:predicted HicB family RNase H-like nuclease